MNHANGPFVATALALAAAVCLYRTSQHQRLWSATKTPARWRWAALTLLAGATALLHPALGLAAASGVVISAAMLGCMLLPFINAWRHRTEVRDVV
ncbi:hypothetical protein [Pelomonas cellulosilytica]|uniref:Uncharacterized protein n=1 Tax=Pelomonas cellulosilytica TaxID=2906762 RepID=A0ABS8XL47_9BURK|nr:hypothetical protein [Pelomonas sp. P8]MCE4553532.1 hypothetical protein [Pelomonas sp. P8]